jgi:hypothetical protein
MSALDSFGRTTFALIVIKHDFSWFFYWILVFGAGIQLIGLQYVAVAAPKSSIEIFARWSLKSFSHSVGVAFWSWNLWGPQLIRAAPGATEFFASQIMIDLTSMMQHSSQNSSQTLNSKWGKCRNYIQLLSIDEYRSSVSHSKSIKKWENHGNLMWMMWFGLWFGGKKHPGGWPSGGCWRCFLGSRGTLAGGLPGARGVLGSVKHNEKL